VLILGSGLSSPPMIEYLAQQAAFNVTVATRTVARAEALVAALAARDGEAAARISCVALDVEASDAVARIAALLDRVAPHCVVSMLPYLHHVAAAKLAVERKIHFATTSYVSDAMQALDGAAKQAGVLLLNECGVDPGLDHMSAIRLFNRVHAAGGRVTSFESLCGGLPAPDANDNPFGYKMSWAPRGVLLASRNGAKWLADDKVVEIPAGSLFSAQVAPQSRVAGLEHALEWYPNRDSTQYAAVYGLAHLHTLVRGTFRNVGWCELLARLVKLGLTSTDVDPAIRGLTLREFAERKHPGCEQVPQLVWLGLLSDDERVVDDTSLDVLCRLFTRRLAYAPGERDMLVMRHTVEAEYSRAHIEELTSTMVDFGQQDKGGHSSMSRTVSLPVAIAVRALLEGRIAARGIQRPTFPELYEPILHDMEHQENVRFVERTLGTHLWIRHEVKEAEERVILPPASVKRLLAAGFRVSVERSPTRCFSDHEYEAAGATLVATGSWPTAPRAAIICGLKELPEASTPLRHRHMMFAHCYKQQAGWRDVLARWRSGGGLLWDLEFLVDDKGRRVAAFGKAAGQVGAALSIIAWAAQKRGADVGPRTSWKSMDAMIADCRAALAGLPTPRIMVLGALGRSGSGAASVGELCGADVVRWDLAETAKGGPFPELLADYDILVNCIYLAGPMPPFFTRDMLGGANQRLAVIGDVSCDVSSPHNPLPLYKELTNFQAPTLRVAPGLLAIVIDHLPSLLPTVSSTEFADSLTPIIEELAAGRNPDSQRVWRRATDLFAVKCAQLD
jgi:saccharopine dehydrogenase (NAD+, L-lysine-forming)